METFWFFWLWFRRAYDSAYNSDFWFSLGHKPSYDSAYDSNSHSIVSENQPLPHTFHQCSGFWLVLINKATWSYKERKENKTGIWGQTWHSNSQPPAQIIFDSNCAKEVKIECCLQHSTTALVYYQYTKPFEIPLWVQYWLSVHNTLSETKACNLHP